MKFVRAFLIFSYGLFTIGAQTLLFREFITSLEGNDISVGLFFFSWFLWVALGAVFINKAGRLAEAMLSKVSLLFLLYLPAFVVQWVLIIQARQLVHIQAYELPSVRAMLLLSAKAALCALQCLIGVFGKWWDSVVLSPPVPWLMLDGGI